MSKATKKTKDLAPANEREARILAQAAQLGETYHKHAETARQCLEAAQTLREIYDGLIIAAEMAVRLQNPQRNELEADERRLKRVRKALRAARDLPEVQRAATAASGKALTAEQLALMEASAGEGFEDVRESDLLLKDQMLRASKTRTTAGGGLE
jgi:hypothetical protein